MRDIARFQRGFPPFQEKGQEGQPAKGGIGGKRRRRKPKGRKLGIKKKRGFPSTRAGQDKTISSAAAPSNRPSRRVKRKKGEMAPSPEAVAPRFHGIPGFHGVFQRPGQHGGKTPESPAQLSTIPRPEYSPMAFCA